MNYYSCEEVAIIMIMLTEIAAVVARMKENKVI